MSDTRWSEPVTIHRTYLTRFKDRVERWMGEISRKLEQNDKIL